MLQHVRLQSWSLVTALPVLCLSSAAGILVALAGCAADERQEEPQARVLPVDGLGVQGLSLAPPDGECTALVDFIERFSEQHAPGVYGRVACSTIPSTDRAKLSFVFGKPGSAAAEGGSAVVTQDGTTLNIVLCRVVNTVPDGSNAATSCFGVGGGPLGSGVPKEWRKDAIKLDDLIASLQDFAGR